jgi:lipoprotein-releasing system ATP-binding protein
LLVATDLTKTYSGPAGPLTVLDGVSLELAAGDALAVTGPSGSGKSTLLYVLGTLEPPTRGAVRIGGRDPFQLDDAALAAFRNQAIGFVFQDHCLLPQCTVLENVLVPTLVAADAGDYDARARSLLERVGLKDRVAHRPAELSGGEKQRVALARALVMQPAVLLCDEPTGNLDRRTADAVAALLMELHAGERTVLIVVTHSPDLAARFPLRRRMAEGRLEPE